MLINNTKQAIETMNRLGSKGIPFIFLIDFEMKRIIISTQNNDSRLKVEMNGKKNHQNTSTLKQASFFEFYPISKEKYAQKFDLVKSEIQRGNSFLLNLSTSTKIVTDLTLDEIFASSEAKYKVLLKDQFVCFSPEIFVQIKDGRISSYPMKGTIDASIPNAEKVILDDDKELAEHYTIVDLIRNDLSRVATKVTVDKFRYIDRITTAQKDLLQVSSEISGVLPENYPSVIGDILFKLLPAGSISGAPKLKTLQIIKEAEGQERGYYTGICGSFDGKNLDSGVMIRYIEKMGDDLYYRSGGGITSMSDMNSEYQEMIDKIYIPSVKEIPLGTPTQFATNEN